MPGELTAGIMRDGTSRSLYAKPGWILDYFILIAHALEHISSVTHLLLSQVSLLCSWVMDVFEVLNSLIVQCMEQPDLRPVALDQIQDGLVAHMEAHPARNRDQLDIEHVFRVSEQLFSRGSQQT